MPLFATLFRFSFDFFSLLDAVIFRHAITLMLPLLMLQRCRQIIFAAALTPCHTPCRRYAAAAIAATSISPMPPCLPRHTMFRFSLMLRLRQRRAVDSSRYAACDTRCCLLPFTRLFSSSAAAAMI